MNIIKNSLTIALICASVSCASATIVDLPDEGSLQVQPLFKNSIASTDINFILRDDASSYQSMNFVGQDRREMPDKRSETLFDNNAFIFEAEFSSRSIEILAHSSFNQADKAERYASLLAEAMGKLPEFMLNDLSHAVIHTGNEGAFSEHLGNFFVVYAENIDLRISNHDLEETVFHETVHAVLDYKYAESDSWLSAQQRDNNFITQYAANNAAKEDLAETALFIYTMQKHPERLPANVVSWINDHNSNKINFIAPIFK